MSNSNIAQRKQALRREIRSAGLRFPAESARVASQSIRDHFEEWITGSPSEPGVVTTAALFAALPGEPDLLPLIPAHPKVRWVLPRVCGEALKWHAVNSIDELISGAFGILEPDPSIGVEIPAGQIELFLVPGRAFDLCTGSRLGRGRGFYDRALAAASESARFVGVGFTWQIRRELPVEPHDRPMNAILTETGLVFVGEVGPF